MNILLLGHKGAIFDFLDSFYGNVIYKSDKLYLEYLIQNNIDYIVSYNYRHIIKRDIIEKYRNRIVNLHISYLPYNRGADPNFWSIAEDTRKGVTIHYIDEGIDTGDILVQKEVEIYDADTLRTSYQRLQTEVQYLFIQSFIDIERGYIKPKKQTGNGTFHWIKDKEKLIDINKYLDIEITKLKQILNLKMSI